MDENYLIKFTTSPRGYLVGYVKKDDRLHFFAAKDQRSLLLHGRQVMYSKYKVENGRVSLDKEMSQAEFPSHMIDKAWYCVWWTGIRKDGSPANEIGWSRKPRKRRKKKDTADAVSQPEPPKYEFHITREMDGMIKVYGCNLIAEYKTSDDVE